MNGTEPSEEELDLFIQLSEVLLDERGLPRETARAFFRIVAGAAPPTYGVGGEHPMAVALDTFRRMRDESPDDLETRLTSIFYPDMVLGPLVRNILIVWYNGVVGTAVGPPDTYPDALVWKAISAHPPGLPGPYYGSWAYPPPRPVEPPASDPATGSGA